MRIGALFSKGRYKGHRFAVYGGKKGYEVSEDGKDDDG